MKRREFIALTGGAATAWPLAARAQQPMPVIGVLSPRSPAVDVPLIAVIRQGLNDTGFFEVETSPWTIAGLTDNTID